jgi:hypothetical protein
MRFQSKLRVICTERGLALSMMTRLLILEEKHGATYEQFQYLVCVKFDTRGSYGYHTPAAEVAVEGFRTTVENILYRPFLYNTQEIIALHLLLLSFTAMPLNKRRYPCSLKVAEALDEKVVHRARIFVSKYNVLRRPIR